jgi:hypothetical protein
VERVKQLEEENRGLLQTNELFQDELRQKTNALAKSARDYAVLKSQYEELLARVTEMHAAQRSQSSQPSPSLDDHLRGELQRTSLRKAEYKSQASVLKTQLDSAQRQLSALREREGNELSTVCGQFEAIVSPFVTFDKTLPPGEALVAAARGLAYMIGHSVSRDRYDRLKARFLELTRKFKEVELRRPGVSTVEEELHKMQRFLDRYERKCAQLGNLR